MEAERRRRIAEKGERERREEGGGEKANRNNAKQERRVVHPRITTPFIALALWLRRGNFFFPQR